MAERTNRRDFLKSSTAAGVGFWVAAPSAWAQPKSANEKVNVAAIGAGGQGGSDIGGVAGTGANYVALCDVDWNRAKGSFDQFPKAKKYKDFRKMLDEMGKDIDAVTISTPDHQHAVAAMMAMKMGKHVYVQKPLTHDVYEARALTKAAKETGVVTQMGNQGTASSGLRQGVEIVRAGAIGPVREVHVWTNRPVWPQGTHAILAHKGIQAAFQGKKSDVQIPSTLDWDLWLGTAPERAYDPIYLPFNWRGWWDYGTGALGDMACHTANLPFMACKLGYPTSVQVEAMAEFNDQTFPMWSVIRYEFPARGDLPALTWTWYDGGDNKPDWVNSKLRKLSGGMPVGGSGSLMIGDDGMMFSGGDYGTSHKLLPSEDFDGYQPPEPTLPRAPGDNNYLEWVEAIRAGDPDKCMSKFAYSGPLTETVVLGCVAMKARKPVEWDGPNMKITNEPDFNKFLKREYRKGWSL